MHTDNVFVFSVRLCVFVQSVTFEGVDVEIFGIVVHLEHTYFRFQYKVRVKAKVKVTGTTLVILINGLFHCRSKTLKGH